MRKPLPFGRYLMLDRIAVGGMAEVFVAKSFGVERFERLIAIKRILPTMVEDNEFISMFIDEARIAASLAHSNIVQIYELGKHDDAYYIAMEYVSGRDARSIIDKFRRRGRPLPIPMAVYIASRVAEGLDHAHRKKDARGRPLGIIHRDVSPQNVLVSYDGEVKLIDFGIAKAADRLQKTQAGILKGKFGYMSPEQVRGLEMDHRADIFSAGTMLWEMLTGTKLFAGETDFSVLEKVRAGEVRPPTEINPEVPPELEQTVMRALHPDREQRYQWCSEFHDDLVRHLYSGGEIFSARSLGSFMHETFADEHKREQERLDRWISTEIPEEFRAHFEAATDSPPSPAGEFRWDSRQDIPRFEPTPSRPDLVRPRTPSGPDIARPRTPSRPDVPRVEARQPDLARTESARLDELGMGGAAPWFDGARSESGGPRIESRAERERRATMRTEIDPPHPDDEVTPAGEGAKARMGPPSAFLTSELRLEQRTAQFNPFDLDPETGNPRDERASEPLDDQPTRVSSPPPTRRQASEEPEAAEEPQEPEAQPGQDAPAPVRPPRRTLLLASAASAVVVVFAAVLFKLLSGPAMGKALISLSPVTLGENVELLVDGERVHDLVPRLPVGDHTISVKAPGFKPFEATFSVVKKPPVRVEVALEPEAPPPQPQPAPAVAGSEQAQGTAAETPAPKNAGAPVRAPEPRVAAVPRPVAKAETPRGAEAAPDAKDVRLGGFAVFSVPSGSMVSMDGQELGKTPFTIGDVPAGKSVQVSVSYPGYKTFSRSVIIKPEERERIMVKLDPDAGAKAAPALAAAGGARTDAAAAPGKAGGKALILAMCTPSAKLLVDGQDTGRWTPILPKNPLEVSAGRHVIACETASGARKEQTVVLQDGETYKFRVTVE